VDVAEPDRVTLDPRDSRRALVAVTLASVVVGLTTTAVTVGTRGMAEDLSLSTVELGWVVNAYLVAAASLVLVGGRLGDTVGRVRTLDLGVVVFAVASLIGVVAPDAAVLIAARVGQGIGAALILPSSIEVIAEYSPPGRETHGFRWRGLAYTISFAVGPLVGGVLTDWFTWRWIFVLDALLVAISGIVAWPLHGRKGRGSRRPTRDLLGASLAAVLVALVVITAERLAVWEFASAQFGGAVAVILVLAALLWRHERRAEHPLLHRRVIQDRRVLGANLATLGASIGMLSLLYFFNLFAQSAATFGLGAVSVLAALVPFIASMVLCAVVAGWLGHRWGPRGPVALGLLLMVVGFALLSRVTVDTTEEQVLLPLAIAGIGAGIANASLTGVAVLHLPAGRINEAAGWNSLARFLGSAMAMAVGTATFLATAATRSPVGVEQAPASGGEAFDLVVARLDQDLSGPVLAATHASTAERFATTMGVTSAVLLVILLVAAWLLRLSEPPAPTGRGRPPR
jgi:MFS family permease